MSASISPSRDPRFKPGSFEPAAPFTTFAANHFVKPAVSAQPTARAKEQLLSFAGAFSDMYTAAPLDLDYDESNAVVQSQQVEFVAVGEPLRAVELPVINAISEQPKKKHRVVVSDRSAA